MYHLKKLKIRFAAIIFSILLGLTACSSGARAKTEYRNATYLGITAEGAATRADVLDPDAVIYHFKIGDEEKVFSLNCGTASKDAAGKYSNVLLAEDGAYPLQNMLMKGYPYSILVENERIISVEPQAASVEYVPVVSGEPGVKTLKNFLKTSCSALGTVLYIYGGGWDFQDCGSSNLARTIGLSSSWIDFFRNNDANFNYREENNGIVYYPINGWNTYYYAGLDCSGYVGWALYNTMYTESMSNPGFVDFAVDMARGLDDDYGFGMWEHPETDDNEYGYSPDFLKLVEPGDVVSLTDHVYIVIGTCEDGSVLIINSTVTESFTGAMGGGVQFNAINNDGTSNTDCDAYRLAASYNQEYFPEWAERYPMDMKPADLYFSFQKENPSSGIFHWNLEDGKLTDPDGYTNMTAEEILEDIFR